MRAHLLSPRTLILLALLLAPAADLTAQRVAVGDPLEDYARVVSLLDSAPHISFAVRPLSDSAWVSVFQDPGHIWAAAVDDPRLGTFKLTPMVFRSTFNSDYASGQNDGLLWQGRGLNTLVEAGATWRKGHFEVTLRPQFTWSANSAFPLAPVADSGRSDYANPWHPYSGKGGNLDVPQRMGPGDYSKASWGESSVRLRAGGWALGVSSEEMWWGPAQRNPIILSNNAPGFAHASLGTIRPVALPGFRFETQWIWGTLHNSGWSDSIPSDRTRYTTGLIASIQPNVLPGLSVGGSRIYYLNTPPGGIATGDLFLVFQALRKRSLIDPTTGVDDTRDQMLTLFARYASPGSGFEAYIEWGRNDHSWDFRDFLMEPEHASASTLGFQKAIRLKSAELVRIAGEWTNLQRGLTQLVRPIPNWYAHHKVSDGWTEEGQFLGAPIGTGSDGQSLWGDLFTRWGRAGLLLQRVARDNDALYRILADSIYQDFRSHQVEIRVQGSGMVFWHGLEIEGALAWEKTFNRYMVYTNDVTNLHFELGVRSRVPRLP